MVSVIPSRKEVSVIHLNADWGYIAYIEKDKDGQGDLTYKVIRVPLSDNCRGKKAKE